MTTFTAILDSITSLFKWWFTVMPWERAVFVRAGKRVRILKEGLYFRIPFLDSVYIQTTRTRAVILPLQTLSTLDKQTLTVTSSITYRIDDIFKLYNNLYHPETTIGNVVLGRISDYVSSKILEECQPDKIEKAIRRELGKTDFGIEFENVKIIGYAVVRTYRLISDQHYMQEELDLDDKK